MSESELKKIKAKLDSLKKMKQLAENKEWKFKPKNSKKLEDDVFDSEKFFDNE